MAIPNHIQPQPGHAADRRRANDFLPGGNLADHARKVRQILDAGGLQHVTIFASGDLDEYVLRDMFASGAPIDGLGIGTHMDTSSDMPYLDCAYKLQEYAGKARRKRS